MSLDVRIEAAMTAALALTQSPSVPPLLGAALPYAVFPGGARIGEAFQVADDLKDALMPSDATGKPAGQDAAHGRPNAVAEMGVSGAVRHLQDILSGAIASIPSCPGEAALAQLVNAYAKKMTPAHRATAAR